MSNATGRWKLAGYGLLVVVLLALPNVLDKFWTSRVTQWIPLAIAAMGLNLLTGYNGQISVGHGAFYGVGAYATALIINDHGVSFVVAIVISAVVCFAVGVAVGLPALRIRGLYLALVTLSLATLFPQLIDQFSDVTGGSTGLSITSLQETSRGMRERPVRFEAPEWTGLASDQWRYYFFLAIAAICLVLSRNIVNSRVGRSIVAIRDNEVAAEVSGVNVASVKVLTFGLSAALAGVGGALLALYNSRVASGSFTLLISIYFLVAVVLGGSATVLGPVVGAVILGVFADVITPELPENLKPATPLILGVLLVISVMVSPGGLVGSIKDIGDRRRDRHAHAIADTPSVPNP